MICPNTKFLSYLKTMNGIYVTKREWYSIKDSICGNRRYRIYSYMNPHYLHYKGSFGGANRYHNKYFKRIFKSRIFVNNTT